MPVQLEAKGITESVTHLGQFAKRARDARPAMRKVRQIMEAGQRKNFQSSGAYIGETWAPLAPGTLARKARKGQDARILRASGALEASLSGGKGKRGGATKTGARAGTAVWYAIFTKGTKTGPFRRIIGINKRDQLKVSRTVEKFLLTGEIFP